MQPKTTLRNLHKTSKDVIKLGEITRSYIYNGHKTLASPWLSETDAGMSNVVKLCS